MAHSRYIKILTRLRGFTDKNCKFFTTPLSHNSHWRLELKEDQTKYRKMARKPRSKVRILIYRTWAIMSLNIFEQNKEKKLMETSLGEEFDPRGPTQIF